MVADVVEAAIDADALLAQVREWAAALGFSQIGVADIDLAAAEPGLLAWLDAGFHGGMGYMSKHGLRRARPAELVPGTVRVITARMDYLPRTLPEGWQAIEWARLASPAKAGVSLYARGRDYHKVLRARLRQLAECIAAAVGPFGHRVFSDSAPVLEVELAARSGIGWRGKHTLAIDRDAGSTFFLGEIYVDMALPVTEPVSAHCGACEACLSACPTNAIVAPYRLDARRCISYLTIEHDGPIPVELRPLMGNRIYGCDDCQLVCPWNKYARRSALPDFDVRERLDDPTLLGLWRWSEEEFLRFTEGSPIRRIGWQRWQRNLAVALGNALRTAPSDEIEQALRARRTASTELVREHIDWALAQAGVRAAPDAAGSAASPPARSAPDPASPG
jgi:epoxyqueuosine reductase